MHSTKAPWLIVLMLVAAVCGQASAQEGKGHPQGRRGNTVLYLPKDSASPEQRAALQQVLRAHGLKNVRKLSHSGICQDQATAGGVAEEDMAAQLLATGAVEFAEPDYAAQMQQIPNDSDFGSQWYHWTVNSPGAWDITTGSASVIVAVIDVGVYANHPDLAANMLLPGLNTMDNSTNTNDVYNHGTGVASLIGAIGNNGAGMAGMAWNVKILPVKTVNDSGVGYESDAAEGITWAADHGAKVVNMSLYFSGSNSSINSAATYLRGKGGLMFASAGNQGADLSNSVGDYASYMMVGATESDDSKASWSNFGKPIDIVAPGSNIYLATNNGGYAGGSGTSFASPICAGLAALIYSINPNFTPSQVENFIFSTCVDTGTAGDDSLYGRGRIDAARAVIAARDSMSNVAPSIVTQPTSRSVITGQSATFSVSASGPSLSYQWRRNGVDIGGASSASYTTPPTTSSDNGAQFSVRVANSAGSVTSANATLTVSSGTPVSALLLGQTGEDFVSPTSETANGTADVHVLLSGVSGSVTGVVMTGSTTGVWAVPFNGANWIVAIRPQANPSFVDLYADFYYPNSSYTLLLTFANGATQTVQTTSAPPPPPTTLQPPVIVSPAAGQIFAAATTSVTVAWNAVPGIAVYLVRCQDLNTQEVFLLDDAWTQTSVNVPVAAGHAYHFWVHSSLNFSYSDPNSYSVSSSVDFSVDSQSAPPRVIHVSQIAMTLTKNGNNRSASAAVTIADANGAVVSGATVSGTWSGLTTGNVSGTSGTAGSVKLSSAKTRNSGTFTFTVNNVSAPGCVYDSGHNARTSASIDTAGNASALDAAPSIPKLHG